MSKTQGHPFWYNSVTKKSVWEIPKDDSSWTSHMSETHGQPFFYNSVTKKSVWEIPKYDSKVKEVKEEKEVKPIITQKPKYVSSYRNNNSSHWNNDKYEEYAICNGNGISTTIRATDKYDAMEQMRDIAQSLNPYD